MKKLTTLKKRPGPFTAPMKLLLGFLHKIHAQVEKRIPVGYEDETGFHVEIDTEDSFQH